EETADAFAGPIDGCWVVDPIDGTHNFLRGVPYWNVAVAYVEQGGARIGVVFDPASGELYHAARGEGGWCDDASGTTRLHAASTQQLAGAYVALGHHDRTPSARYRGIRRLRGAIRARGGDGEGELRRVCGGDRQGAASVAEGLKARYFFAKSP